MIIALALAAGATLVASACSASRLFPAPRRRVDRAVAAAVIALFLPVIEVRLLAVAHALTASAMTCAAIFGGAMASWLVGRDARAQALSDVKATRTLAADALLRGPWAFLAWTGIAAFALAGIVAYTLSPWAWDALGYHLPIVYDALQTRTMRTVPTNIPYVNVYPRAVETFFIAVRLLLDDDGMLDFAQAPYAIAAGVAVAAFARRAGAERGRAIAYGIAFAAVPLVMLELATDYIDIAVAALLASSAYFATGPLESADLVMWAIATGYLLGSKPTAPPVVVILSLVVLARSWRGQRLGTAIAACVAVAILGGEKYVANIVAHRNPIWPIALHAGPITLPGEDDAHALMLQGLPESLANASWLRRVLVSIFVEPAHYIYDMRLGGLGVLTSFGLVPIALLVAPRARRLVWPAVFLACCALASPAAHWMRYTLALPAALLAIAAIAVQTLGPRLRVGVDLALALLAAVGIARASSGLSGGEISIGDLFARPAEARSVAVGVDGHESDWKRARDRVHAGESFAYDASFSLPGLLWCSDARARVAYLGDARSADDVARVIAAEHVRILVAGDGSPSASLAQATPSRFVSLFRCPLDACTVYEALSEPMTRSP